MGQKCKLLLLQFSRFIFFLRQIPPILVPCTWKELKESVTLLKVIPPSQTPMKNTLTYISGGMIFF